MCPPPPPPSKFPKVCGEEETLFRQSAHLLAAHHEEMEWMDWSAFYRDLAGQLVCVLELGEHRFT